MAKFRASRVIFSKSNVMNECVLLSPGDSMIDTTPKSFLISIPSSCAQRIVQLPISESRQTTAVRLGTVLKNALTASGSRVAGAFSRTARGISPAICRIPASTSRLNGALLSAGKM